MLREMMRVRDWMKVGILSDAFSFGMRRETTPPTYLFQHIYAPIRTPTAAGMPDAYTYEDIGLTTAEVARIYLNHYGGNFWPERWTDATAFRAAAAAHQSEVVEKIIYTITENWYKYQKLVELQGFSWNPLWNVDGEELHATIEQHADETTSTNTDITNTRSVAPYDSATLKVQLEDNQAGAAANNTRTVSHEQTGHAIAAADNAFGEALTGGDIYHAEKTIRRGNIGVTKSTELIEAARNTLRWNIVQEFFQDINRVLLIGIF